MTSFHMYPTECIIFLLSVPPWEKDHTLTYPASISSFVNEIYIKSNDEIKVLLEQEMRSIRDVPTKDSFLREVVHQVCTLEKNYLLPIAAHLLRMGANPSQKMNTFLSSDKETIYMVNYCACYGKYNHVNLLINCGAQYDTDDLANYRSIHS